MFPLLITAILEQRNRNHKIGIKMALNTQPAKVYAFFHEKLKNPIKGNVSVDVYM